MNIETSKQDSAVTILVVNVVVVVENKVVNVLLKFQIIVK